MPELSLSQVILIAFLGVAAALAAMAGWYFFRAWQLNLQSWLAGVPVGLAKLLLLHLRRVDTVLLVNTRIASHRAGIEIDFDDLSTHHLAGGSVRLVASALISAKRFGLPLTFARAAAIDLLGKDPVQLVSDAVYEANQIRPVSAAQPSAAGIVKDAPIPIAAHGNINAAAVLLQATPGTVGVIIGAPRLTALVRFPQGDLEVVVDAASVPKPGERVAVAKVDALTIIVAPTAIAEASPALAATP